jgi:hypothetical protein
MLFDLLKRWLRNAERVMIFGYCNKETLMTEEDKKRFRKALGPSILELKKGIKPGHKELARDLETVIGEVKDEHSQAG